MVLEAALLDASRRVCAVVSGAAVCQQVGVVSFKYMRLLELFSGTKSVGQAFAAHGFEVVSIDSVAALSPDICCDVLT